MSNNLGTLTLDLVAEISQFRQGFDKAQRIADQNSREIQRAMREMDERIKRTVDSANQKLNLLAKTLAGAVAVSSVKNVIDMADAYGQMSARIKLTIEDMSEYDYVQKRLIETANNAQRPLQEMQSIFIDTSGNLREMGFSLDQALDITDSFSYALVRNATDAQRAASALRAYDTALNKGRVDAMMWQSISSALPSLEVSMSKIFDIPLQKIQQMGFEGKITTDMLNEAFLHSFEDNKAAAESMGSTVEGVFTVMRNNLSQWIGELNQATGITSGISDGLLFIANNIKVALVPILVVASAMFGRLTTSVTGNALSYIKANIEAMRYQMTLARMAGVSRSAALGITAMGTAARGASIAMSVLGGPVGILAIAAGSLMLFSDSQKKTKKTTDELTGSIIELTEGIEQLSSAQAQHKKDVLVDTLTEAKDRAEEIKKELREIESLRDMINSTGFKKMNMWGKVTLDVEKNESELERLRKKENQLVAEQETLNQKISDGEQAIDRYNDAINNTANNINNLSYSSKEALKRFEETISKIQDETARLSLKTNVAIFDYEVQNTDKYDDFTPEQKNAIRAEYAKKDAKQKTNTVARKGKDIAEEYRRVMESTLSDEERRGLELQKNLDILRQYGASEADMLAVRRAAYESMSVDLPGYDGSGNTLTAQLARINENIAELDQWRELQLQKIEQAYGDEENALAESIARKEEIEEQYRKRRSQYEGEMNQELLNLTQNLSSETLEALRSAGMEASGVYKAMFLANKAASFANAVISAHEAGTKAMNAYALTNPALGVTIGKMVTGIGLANAGIIAATGIKGMAHSGIDKVPETGTWLLEKGERVVTSNTSAKLDAVLEDISRQRENGTFGNQAPAVHSTVSVVISNEGTVEQRQDDTSGNEIARVIEGKVVEVIVKELRPGGILAKRG